MRHKPDNTQGADQVPLHCPVIPNIKFLQQANRERLAILFSETIPIR
jgi:hypothetical protein